MCSEQRNPLDKETDLESPIDLNINFDLIEVKVIADDWAFTRTNSAGTTTVNATGDKVCEGNQAF